MEARNWFEKNGKSGAYLKLLIMKDKKEAIQEACWECTLWGKIGCQLEKIMAREYAEEITEAIYGEVSDEIKKYDTYPYYNKDDVRNAVGSVLVRRLESKNDIQEGEIYG